MGKNFRETLNELLKNPEFKKEWDALEAEFSDIQAMLDAKKASGLTQAEEPNETTVKAMEECYEAQAHPEKYKRYSSFEEVMNEVLGDA